jgi:uncharacterized protein YoxC
MVQEKPFSGVYFGISRFSCSAVRWMQPPTSKTPSSLDITAVPSHVSVQRSISPLRSAVSSSGSSQGKKGSRLASVFKSAAKGELKAESKKMLAKFEDVLGSRVDYTFAEHEQVDLADHLQRLREYFVAFSVEDWAAVVEVRDNHGNQVDAHQELHAPQFPVSVQLPKLAQMFASLSQQQARLEYEQGILMTTQENLFKEFSMQVGEDVRKMQEEMCRQFEMQREATAKILAELEADRQLYSGHAAQIKEEIQGSRNKHEETSLSLVNLSKDIKELCGKNHQILEEAPAVFEDVRKLQKEDVPEILRKAEFIHQGTDSIIKSGVELFPQIAAQLQSSSQKVQQIVENLQAVPKACEDINAKCDAINAVTCQLKCLPESSQKANAACEDIHRMASDLMPMLDIAKETQDACHYIKSCMVNLESMPELYSNAHGIHAQVRQLTSDMTPLAAVAQDAHCICCRMHEYMSSSLLADMKNLQLYTDESRENHKTIVDCIGKVGVAVAAHTPLTADQYGNLQDTMQRVLTEMRNPIPQPKMSFANAVVHVHKEKKHDDVVDKVRPYSYRIQGMQDAKVTIGASQDQASVEAPLPNLTGRLRKPPANDSTPLGRRVQTAPSSTRSSEFRE